MSNTPASAYRATDLDTLNFAALSLAPVSGAGPMGFANIRYNTRQLLLTFDVITVAEPDAGEFGQSVRVTPSMDNVERLLRLENMLQTPTPAQLTQLRLAALDHEHRGTLDDHLQLRLKLKSEGGVWKFMCNNPDFEPDTPVCPRGTRMRVVVAPGFYFSSVKATYGLFYTLKELTFIGGGGGDGAVDASGLRFAEKISVGA